LLFQGKDFVENRKNVRKFENKKFAAFIDLDLSLETTKTRAHYPIDKVCF
jgi:hypothetical protein